MRKLGPLLVGPLLACLVVAPATADSRGLPPVDPVAVTDPMIGTGSGGESVGEINNFPGPSSPFGMFQWSPDTADHYAGYFHADTTIKGFSLTHASVGCRQFGDVPILPLAGPVGATPWNTQVPFSHADEQASPGYYAVTAGTVRTELTTGQRAAQGRFTFPAGADAHMLIKAGASLNGNTAADVRFADDHTVVGSATSGRFCGSGNVYTVHYVISFDRPFTSRGTWDAPPAPAVKSPRGKAGAQISGPRTGAYVGFDVSQDRTVRAKVAISFVDTDGATRNLNADAPAWDFAGMRAATRARWADLLGLISVHGGETATLKTFYTSLYHALQYPVTFNDVDNRYVGFDGKVHDTGGRTQYANFSGWDVYRCQFPLLAMLAPHEASDMIQSLVSDADQYGWLPKWPVYNDESGVMNGDSILPVIAAGYAFGARDFDTVKALTAMVKGATASGQVGWGYEERPNTALYQKLGYVPSSQDESVSMTQEYAIDDFALGQFAKAVGNTGVASKFLASAQNWQNVLDPTTGYVRPRASDGSFPAGPVLLPPTSGQFAQDGFAEGNPAQYTWMVPHDVAGLVASVGGPGVAATRLDDLFTKLNVGPGEPYYWAGNEPMFSVPWTYNYLGLPWKTQDTVRRVQSQLFGATPDGEPGNDDLGAQSAWYVWSALGFYPVTPGTTDLAVNTPLFGHVEIRTGTGAKIVVDARGTGPYVQGMTVNGSSWNRTWLPSDLITSGGRIEYSLGTTHDNGWSTGADAAPKSYRDGEAPALGYLTPRGVSTGNQFTVGVRNTTDRPLTVNWSLAVPADLTASVSSGRLTIAPGSVASTPVTVTASKFAVYPLTATFSTQRQPVTAYYVVQGTDHTAAMCTTLGATNVDCGLTQVEFANDGVTAPVAVDGVSGRRTVQPNGWGYMYFAVDPHLVPGTGPYPATITVRYLDSGTDTFAVQYDAFDGAYQEAGKVRKTGTGTWKSTQFTVKDAKFAQRENGHTDLRISSDGAGPTNADTIASVSVVVSGPDVLAIRPCP